MYYAKGEMYMGMRETKKACEAFKTSSAVSRNNPAQKARSAIRLAGILYDKFQDYDHAQVYYDTAMSIIKPDYPHYANIKSRYDLLTSLVAFTRVIARNDSLIAVSMLPQDKLTLLINNKIEELKETSGNRDFSQGATSAGVTAASAIAALQEAGSKLSRDMIKTSYWAYEDIVSLVVELIRQFYTEDRYFRIEKPNGGAEFVAFSNQNIMPEETEYLTGEEADGGLAISVRVPEFDYKIIAQKMSPFQRESQNQLAIQLFSMGVFNPQMADQVMPFLNMLQFEGIDAVKKEVAKNGLMYQQLLQMIQLATQMAQQLDAEAVLTGDLSGQWMQRIVAITGQGDPTMGPDGSGAAEASRAQGVNGLPATESTITARARQRVANGSAPR
jgi:tetratricopeptide (TPR) repeat protein